jgi:hypothetical protein
MCVSDFVSFDNIDNIECQSKKQKKLMTPIMP